MLQRTIGMLAAAAAASLLISGCAVVDGRDDSPTTLHVMVAANTAYPKRFQQWQDHVAAKFFKETGYRVAFQNYAGGSDELTYIQTSVISGQGPDVYSLGTTFTPTAYATGAFVKLTKSDWAAVGGKNRFSEATLGISGPSTSDQVGVPFDSRPYVMAVNKKILASHGITKMPATWDQLTADAKKTTAGDVYGIAVGYADGADPWKYAWGMSVTAGNTIVKGSEATIDDPVVTRAYKTYFGWLTHDKVVDPSAVAWNNSQALAAFADGKAAFFPMTTTTAIATLKSSAVANDYEFVTMPTVAPGEAARPADGVNAASILSGDNLVVADYSPKAKQEMGFKFIKLITSTDEQIEYYKLFGDMPTNKVAAASLAAQDPKLKPIVSAGALSKATPFNGGWGDTQLALSNVATQAIPGLRSGNVSDARLRSLLKRAQEAAQSAIDRQKNGGL